MKNEKRKTKKILLVTLSLLLLGFTTNAQIKVNSSGEVGINGNPESNYELKVHGDASAKTLNIYSPNAQLSNSALDINSSIYEYYCPLVEISGSTNGGYFLWVNGPAYSTSSWNSSDSSLKKDIRPLDGSKMISKIMRISGKKYEYKNNQELESFHHGDTINKIPQFQSGKHFGLMAQELENEFPELVRHDSLTMTKAINYNGMIPILVETIKEQQRQNGKRQILLDTTKNRLNKQKETIERLTQVVNSQQKLIDQLTEEIKLIKDQCCAKTENNTKKQSTGNNKGEREDEPQEPPRLYQNTPNPFSENTEIRYYLPEETVSATLYIYNMQGRQINSYPVYQSGHGSITIQGSELDPGMYIYTLVADGKEVGTKKMILTR